jgi:S1-C subfamily serine protease
MKLSASNFWNASVVVTLLLVAQLEPALGQYCPSCASGMCSPYGGGWQSSVAPRTRIVAELAPQAGPGTSLQASVSHDAHCRVFVGDGSTGSGTLIASNSATGLVLTCSHLFDDSSADVVVAFPDGSRYAARLADRDPANDLAALLIKRPDAAPLAVDDSEPTGVLTACGYGSDGRFRPVSGTISGAVQALGASFPSVKMTGAVRPGDSGGGVVDTSASLVGVVWGCRDGETYLTCGRPLYEFLNRVCPTRTTHAAKFESQEHDQTSSASVSPQSPAPI